MPSTRPYLSLVGSSLALFCAACSGLVPHSGGDDGDSPSGDDNNGGESAGSGSAAGGKRMMGTGGTGNVAPPSSDAPLDFAPADVRRLTPSEVQNSVRDIFLGGPDAAPLSLAFAREVRRHDFDNNNAYLDASLSFLENVQAFSEAAATAAVARLPKLIACASAPTDETKCATEFVNAFAPRMFRRPATSAERTRLLEVFKQARGRVGFAEAIGIVIEALIQSPNFLFRTELGGPPNEAGVATLNGFETASALSYLIWRSAPDAELMAAAESGKLDTTAGLRSQAERMLKSPLAQVGLRDFFMQLLEVEQLGAGLVSKSDPAFNDQLASAMFEETSRFIDDVLWQGDGRFATMLQQTSTFVNTPLANIYGLSAKPSAFTRVDLDPTRRAGFLTQPAFLAVMTSPSGFNPIFPGLFVRRKLFCQNLPQPPDDIPQVPKDPNLSTREKFAMHSSPGSCQGCHVLLDPIGFGLERYDGLGRYRTEEKVGNRTIPLDGKGHLDDTDVDGAFTGPVELAEKLSQSELVHRCLTTQLLRFALGRDIVDTSNQFSAETYGIDVAAKANAASIPDLLVELVAQEAFVKRDARALAGGN